MNFGLITPPECLSYRSSKYRLVLETLGPLPGERKCFRMINGVLVERTVKDVIPALETNSEGLKKVLEELLKQYKKQQDEMEKWKVSLWTPTHTCSESTRQLSSPLRTSLHKLTEIYSCRRRTTSKWFSNDRNFAEFVPNRCLGFDSLEGLI